ncbi:MAG: Putative anti-sigma factor [uncultured Cytophagales bacterium]|uniref:Anti-sigma factor n=1 Tax=uncultured Cytophagales bacterium TaxID=158755 RepID=A0A6J4JIN0_9SPHI|nr:MAG: Putative anti-sigma factor [uncultured Cytophagales bacterium]
MDYTQFSVAEFADDPFFRSWVNGTNREADAFWEGWLSRHPEKRAEVQQARQLVSMLAAYQPPPLSPTELAQEVGKFRRATADRTIPFGPGRATEPAGHPGTGLGAWRHWQRWAAVLAGLLMLAGAGYLLNDRWLHPAHTVRTPLGGLRELTLPDGSVVTLNANTTLTYGRDWSLPAPREVWLDGEAFFKVVKKSAGGERVKFIVHTGNLQVEVLGTQFNVAHRRGATQVVLSEGKVQLSSAQLATEGALLMQPGEYAALSGEDTAFRTRRVEPDVYSSWRQNKLIFEAMPLSQVAQLLEDNYGLRVTFGEPALAREQFTATIPTRDPDVLLSALAESFNLEVRRSGNQVRLTPNP